MTGPDLAALAAAPGRLAAAIESVPSRRLRTRPSEDEWSVSEVLAHLRSCADVWGDAIATILREDEPTIRAVNPRTYAESTAYPADVAESLRAFTAQREALLRALEALTPEQWERAATVTGAGRPLRRTVRSYADRLARHERPHLKQAERAAAGRGRQVSPPS